MIDDVRPPEPRQRPTPTPDTPKPSPTPQLIRSVPAGVSSRPTPMAEEEHDVLPEPEPFKTPEQVADHEAPAATPLVEHKPVASTAHPWYKLQRPFTKQQKIIGIALLLVVLLGSSGGAWALTHHTSEPVAKVPKKVIQKKAVPPTPLYSTLTGLQITDASLNKKPVTGVMIENSVDARPQSGLGSAGVVFEAVAEGGVTRFLALFQDTSPDNVGPIRSARPYYVQWAMGFDAAYAHVGGSPDALSNITAWGTQDMNQFSNGGSYHRVSSRAAPHNVYTAIDTLNELENKKGYSSTYTGFARKKEAVSKTPNATTISMSLSGYTYDPHYDYDAATNSYKRSEAGQPQMDANTNKQVSPKVVIAIVTPLARGALDSSGAYYSNYTVTGTGTALVFQDGIVTQANWSKPDTNSNISFTDSAGKPLGLNPGQTWITAVTGANSVTYK